MKISVIHNSATHVIKFYSFVDNYGRQITSFYQVIKKPDTSLGAFNSLKRAQKVVTRFTQSLAH
jgi:hypothetical protein